MKALPLWQPWATLVALGAKRIETRSWPAPRWVLGERIAIHATKTEAHLWICDEEPFREQRSAHERAFGDYTPGRFAWELRDVEPVAPIVPFTGRQGIFDVPDELLGRAPIPGQLTVDEVLADIRTGSAR